MFYHTKEVKLIGTGPMGIWLNEVGTNNRYLVPMTPKGTSSCIFKQPTWGEDPCPVCGLEYEEVEPCQTYDN